MAHFSASADSIASLFIVVRIGCEPCNNYTLSCRFGQIAGPGYLLFDILYMNSEKTKTKIALLAVYTALYSLHSELYAATHMHSSTETPIREQNDSSCTKFNVLAIIENTASSLAPPWIELAATRLAQIKEPIELQGFRSEPWVYNLTRERVC